MDKSKCLIFLKNSNKVLTLDKIQSNIFFKIEKLQNYYEDTYFLYGDINKDKIHLNTLKLFFEKIIKESIIKDNNYILNLLKSIKSQLASMQCSYLIYEYNIELKKYKDFIKILSNLDFNDILKKETYELINILKGKKTVEVKGNYLYGIKNVLVNDKHFCESLKISYKNVVQYKLIFLFF